MGKNLLQKSKSGDYIEVIIFRHYNKVLDLCHKDPGLCTRKMCTSWSVVSPCVTSINNPLPHVVFCLDTITRRYRSLQK